MRTCLLALVCVLLMTGSRASDTQRWDLSGGIVDSDFDTGLNVTAGYVIDAGRIRVNLNFVDWNTYSGEAEGFRNETLPSGTEICRDLSNGQFADSERCDKTEIDFAVSVAAGYVFQKTSYPLVIGVGARLAGDADLGGDNLLYGHLQLFSKKKRFFGKLTLSSEYNQLSAGAAF